jgi:hypothetical protein
LSAAFLLALALAATNQDRRSDNDPIVCFFIFTAAVALDCNYADLK